MEIDAVPGSCRYPVLLIGVDLLTCSQLLAVTL
jgi:hypothetical protein